MEAYRLAHCSGETEQFEFIFDVFMDETLIFLEDRYISKGGDGDLVSEMETFMDQKHGKEEEGQG
jgi:hypothetical protein